MHCSYVSSSYIYEFPCMVMDFRCEHSLIMWRFRANIRFFNSFTNTNCKYSIDSCHWTLYHLHFTSSYKVIGDGYSNEKTYCKLCSWRSASSLYFFKKEFNRFQHSFWYLLLGWKHMSVKLTTILWKLHNLAWHYRCLLLLDHVMWYLVAMVL